MNEKPTDGVRITITNARVIEQHISEGGDRSWIRLETKDGRQAVLRLDPCLEFSLESPE
jgi:hypothetical protein